MTVQAAATVPRRPIEVATLLLGVLAVGYLAGSFCLALTGQMPQDLHKRWVENSYFARRLSSFDVYAGLHAPLPEIGPAHPGGYPPWSMAVGVLVTPPFAEGLLRFYFAALNVGALVIVSRYAYGVGARFGKSEARLLAVSVLAIAANAIVVRHGQYGILVNAFLILMLSALAAERPVWGGICLSLASLKPQISGPFALAWLRRRGPIAWVVAGIFVAATTAAFSMWLGRSPRQLLSQGFSQAAVWEGGDAGILRILLEAHAPRAIAIPGLAAVTVLAGAVLALRYRNRSVLVRAALLCVVGRLWTYHRRYDDVMMMFLLLALGERALRVRSMGAWGLFFVVGATLWLPFRESDHGVLLIAVKVGVWLYALFELLRGSAPEPAVLDPPEQAR